MLDDLWLGEQLKANGLVTQEQLDSATQRGSGDLCKDLLSLGVITEPVLLRFLGLQFQTRYLSTEKLSTAKIPQWVLDLLTEELCEQNLILPVRCDRQKKTLSIVTPNPSKTEALEQVKSFTKVEGVKAYVALPHAIKAGIRKFYRGDLHAFSLMDQSLREDYLNMLDIYEQRLIDFDSSDTEQFPGVLNTGSIGIETSDLLDGLEEMIPQQSSGFSDTGPLPTQSTFHGTPPPILSSDPFPSPALTASEPVDYGKTGTEGVSVPGTYLMRTVEVLVTQIEVGLEWRKEHSARIAQMIDHIAIPAGLTSEEAFHLRLAALLHEVGKPTNIHLTHLGMEQQSHHRHHGSGTYMTPASRFCFLPAQVTQILDSMYERFDGQGIPGHLSGTAIPIGARLLSAADCYLDLISNPVAPGGMCHTHQAAINRLQQAAATGSLDPSVVPYFAKMASGDPNIRTGHRPILIIDGDLQSAALLESRLIAEGLDARVVGTTGDAALILLGEDVQMVIAEVDLQPMDGFTFMEWLHSNQRTQHIPFMFISSRTGAEDINRGFQMGAIDYVIKPFQPEVIVAKIKRSIQ